MERAGVRVEDEQRERAPTPPAPVVPLLQLQRLVGNRAVTALLQRDFLDVEVAKGAFGEGFLDAHLDERLPGVNTLIARLPATQRAWMESLDKSTKLSLLHQVGNDGIQIVERICANLVARPPVAYPNPADDGASWRFLLEVARPDAIADKDLGMLGRLPEWVAKLETAYEEAEVHILERDLEGFYRAAEAGRRHLADVRTYAADLPEDLLKSDPRLVMEYLTRELTGWLSALYQGAASSLGLTDYVLLAVGSVGRDEMFPRSDVDYTVLVSALTAKVAAVDKMIGLQLQLMGEPALDEIGKGTPQDIASEHVVTKRDVLLDARTLHAAGTSGGSLESAYYGTRETAMADEPRRHETATALIDTESKKFSTKSEHLRYEDKDVKKGLLRLPTFTTRNLGFYYGRDIDQLNTWDRVADLVEQKILSKTLGDQIIRVVNFASALRLKLHNHYKAENEVFRLAEDVDEEYTGYVLDKAEEQEFRACVAINADLERRSAAFTVARSMTLAQLKEGATLAKPTEAPGTGRDRDGMVRSTKMTLQDGREAVLEEVFYKGSDDPLMSRVRLEDDEYFVTPPSGVLQDTRKGKRIFHPSEDNPFAR